MTRPSVRPHSPARLAASVHADLVRAGLPGFLPRSRTLLRASIAVSSVPSRVPRYLCVVTMLECTSRSLTTSRSAPPASSHEACAWRSPCTVTVSGQSARLDGGQPDVGAEPPARDGTVGHDRAAGPRLVLPGRAALGAVAGIGAPAVLAPAPTSRIRAESAMTVTPPGIVRLGEPERGRLGERPQRRPLGKLGHREQQVIIAEPVQLDECLDLAHDLGA